ncbi:hypothetical protein COU57_05575 [Candidatus Pacearchaeota archaeon CG10_big_fil_rev_8_21_14_0_10_32_14]|nr:MAG: hypothetical protein COU57_05575 [Candidatus Pacearchaeota archaeon CG10_big_fil_rev_8_21_14_0_10_32_14]
MRFFLDANLPLSLIKLFEDLKLDVIHSRDVEMGRASDREIFDYAIKNNSILITKDLEFGDRRLFQLKDLLGLIILRLPYNFTASQICEHLKIFLESIIIEDLENSITIIKLGRYRMREIN